MDCFALTEIESNIVRWNGTLNGFFVEYSLIFLHISLREKERMNASDSL